MGKTTKDTSTGGDEKSPEQTAKESPTQTSAPPPSTQKPESNTTTEPGKPLAPPPRPGQQQTGNTPDYFSNQIGDSLSLEPNPFEQSFGSPPETPGGTKLPSVASLTSPSSLLPGGNSTPFNWGGGSLRTGPLSPAMLSGPANDYFGDTHLRGGFPTPNESSLRTGLTPGGSGSMFPAQSPSTQTLFSQLQSGGPTPSTLDFHRTAINAAAAKREQQAKQASQANQERKTSLSSAPPQSVTSQPQDLSSTAVTSTAAPKIDATKASAGPFDQDSNAANSLYLLAQGRNSAQPQAQFAVPPPPPPPPSVPQAMAAQTAVPIPVIGPAGGVAPASVIAPPGSVVPAAVPLPAMTGNRSPRMSNASLASGMSVPMTNGSGDSARGRSTDGSPVSDASEPARLRTRNKRKRGNNSGSEAAPATNGRRKTQQTPTKNGPAAKKAKRDQSPPADEDMESNSDDDDDMKPGKDGQPKQKMTEEEKRKNFLERNRVAALKCRQRKKQWLNNLQKRVEDYSTENEHLAAQISQLREEVVNLKTLLMAHKDCPVAQQQNLHRAFMQPQMEPYAAGQLNPYGMAAPVGGQPVIAGQVGPRRFS